MTTSFLVSSAIVLNCRVRVCRRTPEGGAFSQAPRLCTAAVNIGRVNSLNRRSAIWSVIRVSSGNFLEVYTSVFGYYATAIGKAFFRLAAFLSLMLSLMTFGRAFMRPLGAIVLGAYADRHGRRAGLLTLTLMSIGIVSIACTPGYAGVGLTRLWWCSPRRLLQGFSADEAQRRLGLLVGNRHAGPQGGFMSAGQT